MHAEDAASDGTTCDQIEGSALSPRETEVLALLCVGLTNNQIGQRLSISRRTVDIHRVRINKRTGAKTPVQLGVWAARNGFAT